MDRKELMEIFNRSSRLGTLSTSDLEGNVNAAVFASARMTDEETVVRSLIAFGD